MKKMQLVTAILIIGALVLSACQQAPATTAAPSSVGGNTNPAPPPPSSNDNAGDDGNTNDNGSSQPDTGEPLQVDDVSAGLNTLNSYATTFEMTFEGTNASGQPESSTFTIVEEFSADPLAKRTTMSGIGAQSLVTDGNIQTIEVDGMVYSILGDFCTSYTADEAPSQDLMFSPSDIIGGISAAQVVGVETVNGVSAQHIIVDVSSLATFGAYTDAKAEAWLADFGVVRYIFTATGSDQFFGLGTGAEGTITWEYNVTNVNQPLDITAPEDCGGVPDDIPLMPDAEDVSAFGELTSYTSPSALADVVAFYEAQMASNGWTAGPPGFTSEEFTTLSFSKDDRSVTITITYDTSTDTSTVLIQLGGA